LNFGVNIDREMNKYYKVKFLDLGALGPLMPFYKIFVYPENEMPWVFTQEVVLKLKSKHKLDVVSVDDRKQRYLRDDETEETHFVRFEGVGLQGREEDRGVIDRLLGFNE